MSTINPIYKEIGTLSRVWNTTETNLATKEAYFYKHGPRVDIIKYIANNPDSSKIEIINGTDITKGQFKYNIRTLLLTGFITENQGLYSLNAKLQRPVIANLAMSIWNKAHK